jgi:hypothetical protein
MSDAISRPFQADPAKELVTKYVRQLVAEGLAEWDVLDNGHVQVRFNTGETFLLAEKAITRLA